MCRRFNGAWPRRLHRRPRKNINPHYMYVPRFRGYRGFPERDFGNIPVRGFRFPNGHGCEYREGCPCLSSMLSSLRRPVDLTALGQPNDFFCRRSIPLESLIDPIGNGIFARTDGCKLSSAQKIAPRRFQRIAAVPFLSGRTLGPGCDRHEWNHGTDPAGPYPATRGHCADARCIPASSLFPGESPKAEHRRGILALGRGATSCVKVQRDQTHNREYAMAGLSQRLAENRRGRRRSPGMTANSPNNGFIRRHESELCRRCERSTRRCTQAKRRGVRG